MFVCVFLLNYRWLAIIKVKSFNIDIFVKYNLLQIASIVLIFISAASVGNKPAIEIRFINDGQ